MAWQFAGSLAAVVLLVLLAWRLGFQGRPQLDDAAHAVALAREIPGGFDGVAVALDRSSHSALVRDAAGRIVLIAPAGAHFVARRLTSGTNVTDEGERLTIVISGMRETVDLGPVAGDWAKAIAALH